MGVALALSALFGLAEATLFFIVPDVLLTALAIRDPALGLAGCAAAVLGALVGGLVMYGWGARDASAAQATMRRIPAIDEEEIARVRARVERSGFLAVVLGPLLGTPYKIYAVEVGRRGMSLPGFLLISVPARGTRFVLVTLVAAWASDGLVSSWSETSQLALAAALWTAFYAFYFWAKGKQGRRTTG